MGWGGVRGMSNGSGAGVVAKREGKDAGPGRIMEEWHGQGRRGRKAKGLGDD